VSSSSLLPETIGAVSRMSNSRSRDLVFAQYPGHGVRCMHACMHASTHSNRFQALCIRSPLSHCGSAGFSKRYPFICYSCTSTKCDTRCEFKDSRVVKEHVVHFSAFCRHDLNMCKLLVFTIARFSQSGPRHPVFHPVTQGHPQSLWPWLFFFALHLPPLARGI
jgi:hypothetical protein